MENRHFDANEFELKRTNCIILAGQTIEHSTMGDRENSLPFRNDPAVLTREYAQSLDAKDPLREFRDQFIIPTKKDLTRETVVAPDGGMSRGAWPRLDVPSMS